MRRLLPLLCALLLLASACAAGTTSGSTDGGAGTAEPAAEPSSDSGAAADSEAADVAATGPVPESLQFSATTVSGESFEGGDFAGQDLMVWFWAPW